MSLWAITDLFFSLALIALALVLIMIFGLAVYSLFRQPSQDSGDAGRVDS